MRRALIQPWRLESLEARTLMSASERVPGEGFDLHLLSDRVAVVVESALPARVELPNRAIADLDLRPGEVVSLSLSADAEVTVFPAPRPGAK